VVAKSLFPTLTDPLLTESEVRTLLELAAPGSRLFERFIETPITQLVEQTFRSDIVRGVVLTDALIGTFPEFDDDPRLEACFLYHVIGGGTGDWDVPVGGMGAVSGSLERSALEAGARIVTGATVTAVSGTTVSGVVGDEEFSLSSRLVVSGLARTTLAALVGDTAGIEPIEGAQVKVNLLLERLPQLKDTNVSPEAAFGGTFHINESASQLAHSINQARAGAIPDTIPCEIYCHSLSDRSILGGSLRESTAHTLTVFALNVPHRLTEGSDPDVLRRSLQEAVLASLDSVLAEPITDCVMRDAHGELCIETKTTADLEDSLGLPGGNIFHEPLTWPFVPDGTPLETPAQRWGVDSGYPGIVIAGASARRGGGVSGIGGHNAAMAAMEMLAGI